MEGQVTNIDPNHNPDESNDLVLLSTSPVFKSFIYKYLMAFTSIILVIVSFFTRMLLDSIFHLASSTVTSIVNTTIPSVPSGVPGFMNLHSTSLMNQYSAGMIDATTITIFMIAPIGIFILFASIGWVLRITEMWTGTALTLGMSTVIGILVANGTGSPPAMSSNYLILLLQWIAFLVQPFSVIGTIIAIAWSEKFRRSIRYTITKDGVWMSGGVWKKQEHMIPHLQIGRIVMEQDFFGSMFNYGTVIPQTIARWGAETSIRGVGATGQKDSMGAMIGYARGREEASRYPLDCLYGIPNPKNAQSLFQQFITRPAKLEEEQLSYLKKIYEMSMSRNMVSGSDVISSTPSDIAKSHISDDKRDIAVSKDSTEEKSTRMQEVGVIRLSDTDFPESHACSVCGKKELPPFVGSDGKTYCKDHYPPKKS